MLQLHRYFFLIMNDSLLNCTFIYKFIDKFNAIFPNKNLTEACLKLPLLIAK